jgi:hypothetical protein
MGTAPQVRKTLVIMLMDLEQENPGLSGLKSQSDVGWTHDIKCGGGDPDGRAEVFHEDSHSRATDTDSYP